MQSIKNYLLKLINKESYSTWDHMNNIVEMLIWFIQMHENLQSRKYLSTEYHQEVKSYYLKMNQLIK